VVGGVDSDSSVGDGEGSSGARQRFSVTSCDGGMVDYGRGWMGGGVLS
jgi:hypothetical protein